MKRSLKIAAIATGSIVALAIVAIALFPYLFRDQIVERIRVELNERLDAEVGFSDVDLSLLSTFPVLTVRVDELVIAGKGTFEGIDLLRARFVEAGIDLKALVFDESIEIHSVLVNQPNAHVVVMPDGAANYDIVADSGDPGETEEPAEGEEGALVLNVEEYEIEDANLVYEERGIDVVAMGLDHVGRFRSAGSQQSFRSKTDVDGLSVRLGTIRYLKKAHAEAEVDAVVDGDSEKLDIESLAIAINRLAMTGSGSVGWAGEGIDLDIAVASKEGLPVKALVSAIPNAYTADFDGLETGGTFSVRGTVQGTLGPDDTDIPSFGITASVRNGRLKYPDLPLALTDVELDAKVEHPGGHLDKLVAAVARYAMAAGKSRAAGSLRIGRPLSGPNVDLILDGRFDLADLAKAYPLPDLERSTGVIEADVDLSAKGKKIGKLTGTVTVEDFTYRPEDAAAIEVSEARVSLSPTQTTVESLKAQVGSSDVSLRGVASPLMTFLSEDQRITASLWLKSKRLRVEDILGSDGDAEEDATVASAPFVLPDDLDAKLDLDVDKLTYGDLVLERFKGSGRIRNRKLTLNGIRADALGGTMKLDGTLTTRPDHSPTFDMKYAVDRVSFAEAFEALPSMRAYAPIARFLDGRFSTDLHASGTLADDFSPKLASVDAGGFVAALQSKLSSDFGPLQELTRAVPAIPKPLDIEGFRTRFQVEDGAVEVKPFVAQVKGLTMMVSGRHGLDQEMSYDVSTAVPIDGLSEKLAAEVRRLGLDLAKVEDVGVKAKLTGSITSPRVSVDVDTASLRGAVADAAAAELAEQRARALQEAQQQADRIVEEAERQAERLREEAKRAVERARQEGYARADQIEREASGNPLKEIAAKQSAKALRRETDKRADQAIAEADRRADQAVAEAQKRADQLMKEAATRSEQATDQLEKQTTDKIR
jgi:hypothetical protein